MPIDGDSLDTADALRAVVALRRLADQLEYDYVERALVDGWSWLQVAEALNVTGQAVREKHFPRLEAAGVVTRKRENRARRVAGEASGSGKGSEDFCCRRRTRQPHEGQPRSRPSTCCWPWQPFRVEAHRLPQPRPICDSRRLRWGQSARSAAERSTREDHADPQLRMLLGIVRAGVGVIPRLLAELV